MKWNACDHKLNIYRSRGSPHFYLFFSLNDTFLFFAAALVDRYCINTKMNWMKWNLQTWS